MIILLSMLLLLTIGDCPRGRTVRAGGYYPSGGLGLILVVLIMLLLLGPAFSFVSALSAAIRFRGSASQAFDTVLITLFIPMAGSIKNTVVAICVIAWLLNVFGLVGRSTEIMSRLTGI